MKQWKQYLLTVAFFASSPLLAFDDDQILARRDFPIVNEYINEKRTIPLFEKLKEAFKLTGDVRAEWTRKHEKDNGVALRGSGADNFRGLPVSVNAYDVELNIYVNYKCGDSWGQCYINYDNSFGIQEIDCVCDLNDPDAPRNESLFGSGFCNDLCVKRMFVGYNAWKCNEMKFDIEIGRRPMYTVFDSRIQFKSRFDGLVLKFSDVYAKYEDGRSSDYYLTLGSFVVDYRTNHFGYVGETGIYDVADSGFDMKYSVIDWRQHGVNRCGAENPIGSRFVNSQFTMAYNIQKKFFGRHIKLYGAIEWNMIAKDLIIDAYPEPRNLGKQNKAAYFGVLIGPVKKAGDWSIDTNWQYVQAQAVPDGDVRGIGRGNVRKTIFNGRNYGGNPNYQGVAFDFLYAITDKLSIDLTLEKSFAANSQVKRDVMIVDKLVTLGGRHSYSKIEVDIIHAF